MRAIAFLLIAALLTAGCANRYEERRAATADMLRPVVPAEKTERLEFERQMRQLLAQGEYDRLQAVADSLRTNRSRFGDDFYGLLAWANSFDLHGTSYANDPETWNSLRRAVDAWRRARPASPLPDVVLAHVMVNRAWQARGGGWASSVSDSGASEFDRNMRFAHEALDHAAGKGPRTLEWYFAAQRVAVGEGWSSEDAEKLFREAQAQDSTCESIYAMRVNYLLPRWYGDEGEWETWLANAVAPLPREEADRIYARVCGYLGTYHRNLYDETGASWPRARQGYLVLLKRHPDAVGLQQRFCMDATCAGDVNTARTLFRMIGPRVDLDVWRSKRTFADLHLWVQERLEDTKTASR